MWWYCNGAADGHFFCCADCYEKLQGELGNGTVRQADGKGIIVYSDNGDVGKYSSTGQSKFHWVRPVQVPKNFLTKLENPLEKHQNHQYATTLQVYIESLPENILVELVDGLDLTELKPSILQVYIKFLPENILLELLKGLCISTFAAASRRVCLKYLPKRIGEYNLAVLLDARCLAQNRTENNYRRQMVKNNGLTNKDFKEQQNVRARTMDILRDPDHELYNYFTTDGKLDMHNSYTWTAGTCEGGNTRKITFDIGWYENTGYDYGLWYSKHCLKESCRDCRYVRTVAGFVRK